MNNDECPICFESLKNKFTIGTPCSHVFCSKCFILLKESECPICRNSFNKKYINKLVNKFKENTLFTDYDFPPLS